MTWMDDAMLADVSREANSLPARVLAMCEARGWGLDWRERAAVLHLEASELVEAFRGKDGSVCEEAADMLISVAAVVGAAGVSWADVLAMANAKVERLTNAGRYDANAPRGQRS